MQNYVKVPIVGIHESFNQHARLIHSGVFFDAFLPFYG